MGTKIKEVDAYIERSPDFARPMLKKMRRLFHKASPKIDETIKWGVPHFEYKGLVGGMAAFKQHVTLGFWKSALMSDPAQLFQRGPKASMCTAKFESADEMPPDDVLLDYIRQAVQLNEDDVKLARKKSQTAKKPRVPAALSAALKSNQQAQTHFKNFSASCQREYIEWINEAKQESTRNRRVAQAMEWIAAGKYRNWKYQNSSSKNKKK